MSKKILVIEDDKIISKFLSVALKTNDYQYLQAESGIEGISLFMANNPDLILLDLGLPDIDGMEVLAQIRSQSEVPIIIISARGREKEKVSALDEGADDYLTKPFNIGELLARMRVALRKRNKPFDQSNVFALKDLRIDFEKRKVFVSSEEIHLTPIEYKIMELLVEFQGKVLTHSFIQKKIWGYESIDDFQTLRVFMAAIRRKIETDTNNPQYILTEVGIGYRLNEE
jgi:two-component system KDP operon response regulator KdpE